MEIKGFTVKFSTLKARRKRDKEVFFPKENQQIIYKSRKEQRQQKNNL